MSEMIIKILTDEECHSGEKNICFYKILATANKSLRVCNLQWFDIGGYDQHQMIKDAFYLENEAELICQLIVEELYRNYNVFEITIEDYTHLIKGIYMKLVDEKRIVLQNEIIEEED